MIGQLRAVSAQYMALDAYGKTQIAAIVRPFIERARIDQQGNDEICQIIDAMLEDMDALTAEPTSATLMVADKLRTEFL